MKKYNVYDENCPSRQLLQIISDKWTILIIKILVNRTYRFGELRREIGGISQKMLSHTLKMLEKNGFLSRKAHPGLPLKVEYSLTLLGKSLSHILNLITDWSEENIGKILKAQGQYNHE